MVQSWNFGGKGLGKRCEWTDENDENLVVCVFHINVYERPLYRECYQVDSMSDLIRLASLSPPYPKCLDYTQMKRLAIIAWVLAMYFLNIHSILSELI